MIIQVYSWRKFWGSKVELNNQNNGEESEDNSVFLNISTFLFSYLDK